MTDFTLGIDLGGTNTALAVLDAQNRLAWRASFETRGRAGFDDFIARLSEAARPAFDDYAIRAAGVAAAAQVDARTGRVVASPNLGFADVPLGPTLATLWRIPVVVENDVNAAAFGEARAQDDARQPLLAVFVGTGVGAGLIVDDRIYTGAAGFSAEIGHVRVVGVDGELCGCGRRGCMEAYAGGKNILRRAGERRSHPGLPFASVADVADAAAAGDEGCASVLADAEVYLGMAFTAAVVLFNPATLVLGGGVMNACPALVDGAVARMHAATLPAVLQGLDVRRSVLGNNAGAIGAAALSRLVAAAG